MSYFEFITSPLVDVIRIDWPTDYAMGIFPQDIVAALISHGWGKNITEAQAKQYNDNVEQYDREQGEVVLPEAVTPAVTPAVTVPPALELTQTVATEPSGALDLAKLLEDNAIDFTTDLGTYQAEAQPASAAKPKYVYKKDAK